MICYGLVTGEAAFDFDDNENGTTCAQMEDEAYEVLFLYIRENLFSHPH